MRCQARRQNCLVGDTLKGMLILIILKCKFPLMKQNVKSYKSTIHLFNASGHRKNATQWSICL
jgi:hypothetical protein